ncbi:unnamed protein product [Schistocephalus solidus]|uniref:C2H2-type domain-containing protein n=1 Tax=Schistocephalus solidus TaxID=70667 RepID=A0A183T6I5_SCHSO|nr:unnamed protein product [Schistocephalus solidus]
MSALSTRLPRANRPDRTPSDAMQQQSDHFNFCVNFFQASLGPPTVTPGTNSPTFTFLGTTYQCSSSDISPITTTTNSDGDSLLNCPHCDRTLTSPTATPNTTSEKPPAPPDLSCPYCARNFISSSGLIVHLQIHRTETDEQVPGAPTCSHRARLHCPHCFRAFTHRMGLLAGRGSQIIVKLKQSKIRPVRTPLVMPSRLFGSNRLERRTALVARELARYKLDIAAHRETRFSEQGQLEEMGAGYTFYWSRQPKVERRDAGFAFAIRRACFCGVAEWRTESQAAIWKWNRG